MLTKLLDSITLKRDCPGVLIPDGIKVTLPAGSQVILKQSLGGDFTVKTDCGDQVRVAGEDADALGKERAGGNSVSDEPLNEDLVWKQLRSVFDPEIPVNIVDLGLVYDCTVYPAKDGGQNVLIHMTLTAPGCGMGEVLKQDVERKVRNLPEVSSVEVELVFDPPWDRSRMTDAAALQLGLF